MGSFANFSGVEVMELKSYNIDCLSKFVRYLILTTTDKSRNLFSFSPFAIHKAITGIGGEPKSVKKLKSGDFLIETLSSSQTKSFLNAKTLLDIPISITPHKSLNSVRGVISEPDLLNTSDSDILESFSDQGVIHVLRITVRKGTEFQPTIHIILTFNKTQLPKSIKAGYLHCRVRPFIPNPIRCYKCQRFGHLRTACRGNMVCARCVSVGHSIIDCQLEPKCANCAQPHESSSKYCPTWKHEKEIQKLKAQKNISYAEARKLCLPTAVPSFAKIVQQKKPIDTVEKFLHRQIQMLLMYHLKNLFQH
ncbi:uncharacterized protein LOC129987649 [Argiope bruennichi]|uniref:uncharacterized protein LOC129987649 n=1 Tax=Argiope bruennichi TaxID=94029 RepID=UPI0024955D18|nr:uncharacterized protein LOC129987649 [Argiope bruennichi]